MRDRALEIVMSRPASADGRNLLREYLQARILGAMQQSGAMVPLAFMGGTALRFLYRIPRFSEDLDFTLEMDGERLDFDRLVAGVGRTLEREGYDVRSRMGAARVVRKASFGFVGILAEAGLSAHADQVLYIKLEVDTNPPSGAGLAVTLVDRFGPLRLQHHDLPSLFAGKIAALIGREYTKGRDLYDLLWYLTREELPQPNVPLLVNALEQTSPDLAFEARNDWRGVLWERLREIDWDDARRDVAPFLEESRDLELITPGTFEDLI